MPPSPSASPAPSDASPGAPPATGVIVTGGASGIGAASARALAATGRPVALWDRADPAGAAEEIAAEHSVPVHPVTVDVTDTAALASAAAETRAALGSIGGLVHAAGIPGPAPVGALDEARWDAVLDVNLRAQALIVQEILDDLKAHPGSAVVGISSIEGLVGNAFLPAYCASKAGLLGLTRSLAHLLAADGVRVNAVCPGYIDTPMLRRESPGEMVDGFRAKAPLGRLGEASDVANAVRFLMGAEASFITGAHLTVDGGVTAVEH
ncbi:SDR family NAD(P)-dependent oxidoreductase [Actinomadura fibrosa]|uniref:SDR family NAD(P)-dependent oxidoreductase n=1 Tax=Actinomadura fibrosa TaxID=111802 RepID=A0ABW2Y114_9ACTN|nr:SDR family oxidoreductase [Actinomadura fibrosa]